MPIEKAGYTKKTHPELYELYGAKYMRTVINPFVKAVAKQVDTMEGVAQCAYVELSGKSVKGGDTIAFADFLDGVRLWVSLDDPAPVLSRWDQPNAALYSLDGEELGEADTPERMVGELLSAMSDMGLTYIDPNQGNNERA